MKFAKIVGNIPPEVIAEAEKRLTFTFIDLSLSYTNTAAGSKLGGDPLIFALLYPVDQVCTRSIPTAATNGKKYYWNPDFINSLSNMGLRIVAAHEAWHAIYMHPQRRAGRLPKLWNIAVDYIVNGMILQDLRQRGRDPIKEFTEHLGKLMLLSDYVSFLQDPFAHMDKAMKDNLNKRTKISFNPEKAELTEKEKQALNEEMSQDIYLFADPKLPPELETPDAIYSYLYDKLPKCSACGSVGKYKLPQDIKPCDNNCDHDHACSECGHNIDIFDLNSTLDEHMDTEEDSEKIAKRFAEAVETAKMAAGKIPGGIEAEIGNLTKSKITWQDVIRGKINRVRLEHKRNNWSIFKMRPMFAGLLSPKKRRYDSKFHCLIDTSGSMSAQDIAFGVSQLLSLDSNAHGTMTCGDAQIYWEDSVSLDVVNKETLKNIKIVGRGGTVLHQYFKEYERRLGATDFIIVITDGFLEKEDINAMVKPNVDVFWIITSAYAAFKPPFGKAFHIKNL